MKQSGFIIAFNPKMDQVLMGLRSGGNNPGKWDFFGGTLEYKEKLKSGAIREFKEETGLPILTENVHHLQSLKTKNKMIHIFTTIIHPSWKPILNEEHSLYGWFDINGLRDGNVTKTTKRILKILK